MSALQELTERLDSSNDLNALIDQALAEDIGDGDLTTNLLVPASIEINSHIIARESGILCGVRVLERLIERFDARFRISSGKKDGEGFEPGDVLLRFSGSAADILSLERLMLNFLQRLSGVASTTRRYVDAVAGHDCEILETRKTIPGWRLLDKWAVAVGGGTTHRLGLFDQVLAKENHFSAAIKGGHARDFADACRLLVENAPSGCRIEVEVENFDELRSALAAGVDIVLCDNMSPELLREAVALRDAQDHRPLLEASGGISLDTVADYAAAGVDRISVGALTHSVRALDLSLLNDV